MLTTPYHTTPNMIRMHTKVRLQRGEDAGSTPTPMHDAFFTSVYHPTPCRFSLHLGTTEPWWPTKRKKRRGMFTCNVDSFENKQHSKLGSAPCLLVNIEGTPNGHMPCKHESIACKLLRHTNK